MKKRAFVSLLLAALLVMPMAYRGMHIFGIEYADRSGSTKHNCRDCPLCLFTLSLFTTADPGSHSLISEAPRLEKIVVYISGTDDNIPVGHYLRGPPFHAFTDIFS